MGELSDSDFRAPPSLHTPRPDESILLPELDMLRAWLGYLRAGAVYKLEGLDAEQVRWRPTPGANSLGGIVMHLGYGERQWIRVVFAGEEMDMSWAADRYASTFFVPGGWGVDEIVRFYEVETAAVDGVLDAVDSIEARSRAPFRPTTLRWALTHMVEEIARHLGHVTAKPIPWGDEEMGVTCSIGIALFPADGDDAETLIRNADTAMYQAKRDGRGAACLFTPAMHHTAERRHRLDARLRKALDAGDFRLNYQPIYELNGTLFASEALLRWPQPDGTVIQPADFIPYAEESGLIVPIGAWVVRSACYRNAAWGRIARPLRACVNVSAKQLADPGFVHTVRAALSDSGLRPDLLELELTETAMSANMDRAAGVVRELRALGVRIAIDDFGTGFNSLATLRAFEVDTLKLDACFVADVATSPVDQAIASAVITAAHRLGASVVAEGVETAAQRAALAALDCDAAQGFLFGRPMAAEAFSTLLRAASIGPARRGITAATSTTSRKVAWGRPR